MIRDKIDSLTGQERRRLMYAFEHDLTQIIYLPNNRFIGVNVYNPTKKVVILEQAGKFSYGEKIGNKENNND